MKLLLCSEGAFLVETVDVVDLIDCILVAGAHADLLGLRTALPLCLLAVELLQLLPELIGGLLLLLPMALLFLLVFFVSGLKVLFVVLCLLGLLGLDFTLVLGYFFGGGGQFLSVAGSAHGVLLLFPAVEFQLIAGALDREVDLVLMACVGGGVLSACSLTTIDLDMFLGSSWCRHRPGCWWGYFWCRRLRVRRPWLGRFLRSL